MSKLIIRLKKSVSRSFVEKGEKRLVIYDVGDTVSPSCYSEDLYDKSFIHIYDEAKKTFLTLSIDEFEWIKT